MRPAKTVLAILLLTMACTTASSAQPTSSQPAAPATPPSPAQAAYRQAQTAISSGDLLTALKFYKESAAADPKFYDASFYAGEVEFKLGHYAEADKWLAQAVKIDPNREAAFRVWGDCLMKLNNPLQAEAEYIEALIVEPYAQTTRGSLINWAEQTKAQLAAPPIALPARATPDAKGSTNVAGDLASLASSTSSPWLAYSMNSTLWQQTEFKKHFPNETKYRHSLAEEAEGIRSVLAIVKQRSIPDEKLDVSLKWLKALEADGMLECWILLDHADPGIARDYVAYRTTHRDQLIAYIVKYDIHSNR